MRGRYPIAMTEIAVLAVASDPLSRAGLTALLRDAADDSALRVVGAAAPEDFAVGDPLALYQPAVVVWESGWEASASLAQLAEVCEGGAVVVALVPDAESAGQVWAVGVAAVLPREVATAGLAAAVVAVAAGLTVLHAAYRGVVGGGGVASRDSGIAPVEVLTAREVEVLALVAEGYSNRQIAGRLSISEHTVKFHINAIMGKLGAQSRTEAVVRATRLGVLAL